MPEDYGKVVEQIRSIDESVKELKAAGKGTAELEEKMEKLEKAADKLENLNQEVTAKFAAAQKAEKEQKETIEALEAKLIKMNTSGGNAKDAAYQEQYKAIKDFAAKGKIEEKYYRTDSNEDGGFLMNEEALDELIIKKITEVSDIRQHARVKRVSALALGYVTRSNLVESFWTGEGVTPFPESQSKYAKGKIVPQSMTLRTRATTKALQAGNWSLDTEIMGDFAEERARKEGLAFVSGDGSHKPRGFLDTSLHGSSGDDDTVTVIDSGLAADFTFDNLIDLTGELKTGYKPMYGMNRKTLAYTRKLKDGADAYIWRAGNLGAGIPNAINGDPYIEIPDMPNVGAGTIPVVYADWAQFYTIVDAFEAILLRNPYREDGFVHFTLENWVGGDVSKPEAGALLKCVV